MIFVCEYSITGQLDDPTDTVPFRPKLVPVQVASVTRSDTELHNRTSECEIGAALCRDRHGIQRSYGRSFIGVKQNIVAVLAILTADAHRNRRPLSTTCHDCSSPALIGQPVHPAAHR